MLLSKEAILAAQDLETQDIEVPQWGGVVRVRVMTGADREAFYQSIQDLDPKSKVRRISMLLIALCAVDEEGNRLFTEEDVETLARKSSKAIERVAKAIVRLNRLNEEAVEEAEKN